MNSHSIKSFSDLPHVNSENTVTSRKPANEFDAETKIYYQEKGYGFLFVTIPENWKLSFNIESASADAEPGKTFTAGTTLERPVVIEAFVHGSVLYKAGHEMGLVEGQKISVKLTKAPKGIQVSSVPNADGSSSTRENNVPRPFNKALKFVDATVKAYFKDRDFGFVCVTQDPKTGETLPDGSTREVFFNKRALDRAGYDTIETDTVIKVRYWTFENGRSTVTQFIHKDRQNRTEDNDSDNSED